MLAGLCTLTEILLQRIGSDTALCFLHLTATPMQVLTYRCSVLVTQSSRSAQPVRMPTVLYTRPCMPLASTNFLGWAFPVGLREEDFFLQGEQQRCFQRDKKMLRAKLSRKGINRCCCTEFMVISQASEKPKVQPPQLVLSHAVSAVPQ